MTKLRATHAIIISIYALLVGYGMLHHELTFAEAQAWLIARDASLWEIFSQRMRYEGNPGLWHLLLVIPAKLGLPYYSPNVISAVVGTLTAALIVIRSPFPLWLRAILPFMAWLSFDYVIVARPYCLLALLLLAIASIFHERSQRIFTYFLLLTLLALTSVHGALLGVVLCLFSVAKMPADPEAKKRTTWCILAFGALLGVVALELWPAADAALSHESYQHFNFDPANFYRTSSWALNNALTGSWYLTAPSLIAFFYFFYLGRTLLLSLTLLAFTLTFFALKGLSSWHLGILELIFIFGAWTGYRKALLAPRPKLWAVCLALLPYLSLGLTAAAKNYRHDRLHLSAGGEEIAKLIKKNNLQSLKIYGYGQLAPGVLPYFPKNIFANNGSRSYNLWQKNQPYQNILPDPLPKDADVILISDSYHGVIPDLFQLHPQLKQQGWIMQKSLIVPLLLRGAENYFLAHFLLTRGPTVEQREPPLVSARIDIPPRLRALIKSGKGYLGLQLVDAKQRARAPYFASVLISHPQFPYQAEIYREDVAASLNNPAPEETLKSNTVSFRAFYFGTEGRSPRPTDPFAYLRQRLTWNRNQSTELGPVSFQGYNTGIRQCSAGPEPLLSGTIELDREMLKRFPTKRFILAAVGNSGGDSWESYSYSLAYSQDIDLEKTNSFTVPAGKATLLPKSTGRFLLYLLDPRGCSSADHKLCAERLIQNRDDDMTYVIPMTTESLVTPYCGQTDLKMVGFYEPDWATIPVPPHLLR